MVYTQLMPLTAGSTPPDPARPSATPRALLAVLVVVYVFNFLDRQILSILSERIKADLHTTDAQMGFLYGTAFAVFFALFGIPLGRLADVWDRRLLISIGLAFWSLMTAASGLARSFVQLAAARIGVGVGEASASPAAYSMLADSFPPARRATVLAIYSSGIYIGAGLGMGIGGLVVDRWDTAFGAGAAPLGLRGWQVAFALVGLPGLLLALWVRRFPEPVRGAMDGLPPPAPCPQPFREFARELRAVIPPFTVLHLVLARAGWRAIGVNLLSAGVVVAVAWALTHWLGTAPQWIALGTGIYAAISWAQSLQLRDPLAFSLLFRSTALPSAALGFSFLAFTGYATGFWTAPFLVRMHGLSEARVGFVLGANSALAGWLGVTTGGLLADRWRARWPHGRLVVGLLTAVAPLPFALWMFRTDQSSVALALSFPLSFTTSMWLGSGASTVQDLVLPHLRATASAFYLLVVTFVGLALGPYVVGVLSVRLGDLRAAIQLGLFANLAAAIFLIVAIRTLPGAVARVERLARESRCDPPTSGGHH